MVFPEEKDLRLLFFKDVGIQSAQASHACCLNDHYCLYSFFNKTKEKGEYLFFFFSGNLTAISF